MTTADLQGEPHIVVNGVTLGIGQAMALRVAVEMFVVQLDSDMHGLGQTGRNYRDRLIEVRRLMSQPQGDRVSGIR